MHNWSAMLQWIYCKAAAGCPLVLELEDTLVDTQKFENRMNSVNCEDFGMFFHIFGFFWSKIAPKQKIVQISKPAIPILHSVRHQKGKKNEIVIKIWLHITAATTWLVPGT